MRRRLFAVFSAATALILILFPSLASAGANRQDTTPSTEVSRILEVLSPEERVGQLFVATFQGTSVEPGTAIHTLITRHHLGGVVLTAASDNFDDSAPVSEGAAALTAALQQTANEAAHPAADENGAAPTPTASMYVPLLIGIQHEGNGASGSEIYSGLTPLPSAMALGATWNPEHARLAGDIVGAELSAIGINLLLGPDLDVLLNPRPANLGDVGVRSFGGNGYWVGRMGRAYLEGVKSGSAGRVAVIAKHYPGLGSSDRDVSSGIPTVNQSAAALATNDLPPFQAVANPAADSDVVIDGLLAAHARYTAFQGAVSSATRPLNLDGQALGELLRKPAFANWRASGGLIMSDRLGTPGLRLYYDPTGATFPAFNIARDALLAGNDLLFVGDFGLNPPTDEFDTIVNTIALFVQKYEEDPAFAERVDAAAARILELKLRLYGEYSIERVTPNVPLDDVGRRSQDVFAIARDSVTLLSPSSSELANRLPQQPVRGEQVVFITDTLAAAQCSTCIPHDEFGASALQFAVTRLYGAGGSSQIRSTDLSSFSFDELDDFMSGVPLAPTETPIVEEPTPAEGATGEADASPEPVETAEPKLALGDALAEAEWIVFALRDIPADTVESNPLRRFLAERPDLLAGKKVVVFAFGAPYLLDTTEVAQLSAYYGLYSHSAPFVEVAARVLFGEVTPAGAAPVTVSSTSYDLARQLAPAQDQPFDVFAQLPDQGAATEPTPGEATPTDLEQPEGTPAAAPVVPEGTTATISTSSLIDQNGHVVPDGTGVDFFVRNLAEGGLTQAFAHGTTIGGVAQATLVLDRTGRQEIWAESGAAVSSPLQIEVFVSAPEGTPTIIFETVTPQPTSTSAPPTQTAPAPTATPTPVAEIATEEPPPTVEVRDLLSALLALVVFGAAGWRISNSDGRAISAGVKIVLAVAIGVGAGYNYYALQLPGWAVLDELGSLGPTFTAWAGGGIGLLVGSAWLRRSR
ncbi:MAG: glycoside hydrolase family 3 N-terminal domain-containing protein [Anaerolineales bacterium]